MAGSFVALFDALQGDRVVNAYRLGLRRVCAATASHLCFWRVPHVSPPRMVCVFVTSRLCRCHVLFVSPSWHLCCVIRLCLLQYRAQSCTWYVKCIHHSKNNGKNAESLFAQVVGVFLLLLFEVRFFSKSLKAWRYIFLHKRKRYSPAWFDFKPRTCSRNQLYKSSRSNESPSPGFGGEVSGEHMPSNLTRVSELNCAI